VQVLKVDPEHLTPQVRARYRVVVTVESGGHEARSQSSLAIAN
jgi:hypothetical protein